MRYRKLIAAARKAQQNSHSPYSKFRVGAALMTADGAVYTGCNIEISSFALTICAERTALFKAVSEGAKRFSAIAVTSASSKLVPPCGACRQVLMDLAGDIDVVIANRAGRQRVLRVRDLFPHPFVAEHFSRNTTRRSRLGSRRRTK